MLEKVKRFLQIEDFYSHLNLEYITDADYRHGKEFVKVLKYKVYRWIPSFVCSMWYIIACSCVNSFWKMCLEIYDLYPAQFAFTPGLVWQAAIKKTKTKLNLLTDIDKLLKVSVVEYVMLFINMWKLKQINERLS